MLSIGQALAAGGLLGDVFLHTLPHAMEEAAEESHGGHGGHDGHDGHDHGHLESIGLAILCGFLIFYLFDILVRSFGHDHDHNHHAHDGDDKGSCKAGGRGSSPTKTSSKFTSAVILNLVADSLHNFTDGIAIGASFAGVASSSSSSSSSVAGHDHTSLISQVLSLTQSRGGLASLAVLFHEIPHELGDFSILVSAGMTKKQAIMTQFSTAIAAYCGTFFGLLGMEQMKSVLGYDLMIPFTAGGFVYLAGVTILPSLLQEKRSFTMRIVQFMSFVIGISFMYFVAVLEHQEGGGHSHSAHEHEHEHDHVEDHSHGHVDHHDHHSHEHGHGYDHHHDEF